MELPGANYLYALATISVTFVGFSALLLVFRETIGGKMTRYDSYFTLSFMQAGFIVTAGGLLPHLLAFYGMSETSVWRAASAIMAIPIFLFVANTPRRRRAATKEPIPFYVWLLLLLQFLAGSADCFLGSSATIASVVIRRPATDAAPCSAARTPLAGSMMPLVMRLPLMPF